MVLPFSWLRDRGAGWGVGVGWGAFFTLSRPFIEILDQTMLPRQLLDLAINPDQ